MLINNKCLKIAEFLYGIFHTIDPWGEYRINIVLRMKEQGAKGHAWLTRNGRDFITKNKKTCILSTFQKMGDDGKYVYYIVDPQLREEYEKQLMIKKQ